jgi:hypothetical protein
MREMRNLKTILSGHGSEQSSNRSSVISEVRQ